MMTLFSAIVFALILHSLSRTTNLRHTCLCWALVDRTSSWASNGSKTWALNLLSTQPLQCHSPIWAARLTCTLMYHSSPLQPHPTKCIVWCNPKELRLCSNSPRHPTQPKPVEAKLPSLFWWCQRLKSRIKIQESFKNQRFKKRLKICKNLKKNIKVS